jgi:hypothetical protein
MHSTKKSWREKSHQVNLSIVSIGNADHIISAYGENIETLQ